MDTTYKVFNKTKNIRFFGTENTCSKKDFTMDNNIYRLNLNHKKEIIEKKIYNIYSKKKESLLTRKHKSSNSENNINID